MGSASKRLREYGRLIHSDQPLALIPQLENSVDDFVRVAPDDQTKATVLNYYGLHNFQAGNHAPALQQFQLSFELTGAVEALRNALIVSRKLKADDALQSMEVTAQKHLKSMPDTIDKAELFDVLCHNAGSADDLAGAVKYGREALRIKEKLGGKAVSVIERKKPDFNFYEPARNIVSFSLFGANPRYLDIAIENAQAVSYVYPGWSCRFYCDESVPAGAIERLAILGAKVRILPVPHDPYALSGLFWRFLVAQEADVDFFIVRDADSLINVREKVAVDEWLASPKGFHAMRDFYTHSELLLAGMWGGVGGRLNQLADEIEHFHSERKSAAMGASNHDQVFLRHHVWPAIRDDLMVHDSVFKMDGSQDFPEFGKMQPMRHVGQDMNIFKRLK